MTNTLESAQPDLGAVKQRQQQTWASGDFAVVAARIVLVAEQLLDTADLHAGWRVLDVATGSGNAALAAARPAASPSASTTCRRCSSGAACGPRPRASRRAAGRRRRGAAVPRRLLRRRHLGLRVHVRARPRADGRRAAPRLPPGRHDRTGELDARGLHRRALPHASPPTYRPRPECSRRCSGAPRRTCASSSASASPGSSSRADLHVEVRLGRRSSSTSSAPGTARRSRRSRRSKATRATHSSRPPRARTPLRPARRRRDRHPGDLHRGRRGHAMSGRILTDTRPKVWRTHAQPHSRQSLRAAASGRLGARRPRRASSGTSRRSTAASRATRSRRATSRPAAASRFASAIRSRCSTRSRAGARVVRGRRLPPRPRRARARRPRARPRLGLRHRRVLRRRHRRRGGPRRRRRLHRRPGRDGHEPRGAHGIAQRASSSQASIDRLPFEDGSFDVVISNGVDQPVAGQAPRLRRGRARPASGRPPRARRHRQRDAAEGVHAPQHRALGRVHRGRDPVLGYLDALAAAGFAITATRPTPTASSATGPSRPPRPTASRA